MMRRILARYRAAYSGLPREVWVLAVALFINRCGAMVLPFMTLYLTSQVGISESSAGRLISVYGLGSVVGVYLGGRLTSRIGAIRIQTICLFLSAPMFLVLPLFEDWWSIASALFVLSAISGAVRPSSATAVAHFTVPENRTRAFALTRLAANLGFSFGPAVGGFLATIDYGLLFSVDALTTFGGACLLLAYFRMPFTEQDQASHQQTTVHESPLRDFPFSGFLLLILLTNVVFFQLGSTYPLYLRDHFQFTKPMIGAMFAVNTVTIVVFEMVLVDYVRRWHLLFSIGLGCLLVCLGFGLLPFGTSAAYCVLCMVVVTTGEMLSFPLSSGFVANRAKAGNESMYLSWYTLTFSVAAVIGPALGTSLYGADYDLMWYISIAVGAAVVLGFVCLSPLLPSSETRARSLSPARAKP